MIELEFVVAEPNINQRYRDLEIAALKQIHLFIDGTIVTADEYIQMLFECNVEVPDNIDDRVMMFMNGEISVAHLFGIIDDKTRTYQELLFLLKQEKENFMANNLIFLAGKYTELGTKIIAQWVNSDYINKSLSGILEEKRVTRIVSTVDSGTVEESFSRNIKIVAITVMSTSLMRVETLSKLYPLSLLIPLQ